ncbi:Scr1 family TA system antitoxin-like transcriptional regulator [Streptomyces gobiensis]|uniref:Scr1 family TA system antitoxin-like transcriptional regulator n=1 Tax=Streptomyces gobiensis TaxID=2875706 RepID=UPI001E2D6875|nr:Scr1 family TA system antitoxin-like transcriptional regulator [Streptomyces gobiensis]UGY92801.1 Scr1 family TA system antitoxin-like transcriptional regulator [Streptomyces gobiensis]
MPPREAPTARQRRLGTELRKMRERAGMTAQRAAEAISTNRTGISNLEAGRFGISADRVRTLASIYACADQMYIDALATMAEERRKGWWEEYRGSLTTTLLDLAELEHRAVTLHSMQSMHVPGLLQTEEYAKAVFSTNIPQLAPADHRRLISFRMRRRDVLDKPGAPQCTFLIHEAAMRMEFGGAKVLRSQLQYLLEASERDNITIRAVPFSAGGHTYAGSSILYACGPVRQLDTVHLDLATEGVLIDAETHLANYRAILEHIEETSLPPKDSRDFIRNIAHKL